MKSLPATCLVTSLLFTSGAAAQTSPASPMPPGTTAPAPPPAGEWVGFVAEQPLGHWRGSTLVGTPIVDPSGERIGEVKEFLVDESGAISTVLIGVGGFLGVGEKDVGVPYGAVEWSSRSAAQKRSAPSDATGSLAGRPSEAARNAFVLRGGDPRHGVLRATRADLERAPRFIYTGRPEVR